MKKLNLLMGMMMIGMLAMVSCDEDCLYTEDVGIAEVSLSEDTISLNNGVDIELKVDVLNGCGEFNNATFSENGDVVTVDADAVYSGCVCTEAIERKTTNVTFTPTTTGTKVLEFNQLNGGVLRDTLVVQ